MQAGVHPLPVLFKFFIRYDLASYWQEIVNTLLPYK